MWGAGSVGSTDIESKPPMCPRISLTLPLLEEELLLIFHMLPFAAPTDPKILAARIHTIR